MKMDRIIRTLILALIQHDIYCFSCYGLALLAPLWNRSVAYKDRGNFEVNRKSSLLADDVYEAYSTLLRARCNRQ